MGLIANYQYIDDANLDVLLRLANLDDKEEVFETIEDLNEEAEIFLDTDKMWDVMHFVLTGVSTDERSSTNPLSVAVIGVDLFEDLSQFVACVKNDRVPEIISALESFDYEKALENFNMEDCASAGLYPNIWDEDDEDLVDELIEEIADYIEGLRDFYKKVLEAGGHALITIY